jgi:2,4'-dihydroxyacetophenone dioxygenase
MAEATDLEGLADLMGGANGPVPTHGRREAIHIGESDLPFVDIGDGNLLQLLQVDLNQGLWVVRNKFHPGYMVDTHYHTGIVFALTMSGSWYYEEYPDLVNTKGSYLFEPAQSVHTLKVSEDNDEMTDVWFAIYGSNINIDGDGNVTGVVDSHGILDVYRALCEAEGKSCDNLIVLGDE